MAKGVGVGSTEWSGWWQSSRDTRLATTIILVRAPSSSTLPRERGLAVSCLPTTLDRAPRPSCPASSSRPLLMLIYANIQCGAPVPRKLNPFRVVDPCEEVLRQHWSLPLVLLAFPQHWSVPLVLVAPRLPSYPTIPSYPHGPHHPVSRSRGAA